jgi:hypothetical protein
MIMGGTCVQSAGLRFFVSLSCFLFCLSIRLQLCVSITSHHHPSPFCRYQNLKLPTGDEYVQNDTFVQAQGHRAVCRMLPFLLRGLLDDHFLALIIAWEQFQQLCHGERRPGGLTRKASDEIRCVRLGFVLARAIHTVSFLTATVISFLQRLAVHRSDWMAYVLSKSVSS